MISIVQGGDGDDVNYGDDGDGYDDDGDDDDNDDEKVVYVDDH